MQHNKSFKLILLLLLSLFLTTGCYNKKELDNLAYVIGIGADIGSGDNLDITYQIAIPLKVSSNEGKTGEENFTTYTVSAPSLYVGNSKVNALTSKEVNLSHVKLIVYSEELAKNDLSGHINSLISNVSIRPKTTVAICKNSAKDFLKNITPDLESSPARYYELLFSSQNRTNESAKSELIDFYTATTSIERDSAIILLSNKKSGDDSDTSKKSGNSNDSQNSEQNSTGSSSEGQSSQGSSSSQGDKENSQKKFAGLAVFKGSKMVGEIPQDLIMSHLILTNELKQGDITVYDAKEDGKLASIFLRQEKKCKYDVTMKNDIPEINIKIKLTGHLRSSTSTTDYLDKENKNILTSNIEKEIKTLVEKYIQLTQSYNTDTAGIGRYVKQEFLTWDEFEKLKWNEQYKNARFNINVDVDLNVSRIIFHRISNI
ncbi:MAG: Ger(x)C family spore germination protein [Clostridia bacterium]|nr:Ger(x)C family spore germination protein [Clostridia bacterium]